MHAAASRGNLPHHQLIYPPSLRYLPVWTLGAPPCPPRPPHPVCSATTGPARDGARAPPGCAAPGPGAALRSAAQSAAPTCPGSQGGAAAARAPLCAALCASEPRLSRPGPAGRRAVPQCYLKPLHWAAGIIKSTALRGGKEVVTDERAAVGLEVMAASVPQLLRLLYPALYPVHDPAGDWGRPGPDGRCGPRGAPRLLRAQALRLHSACPARTALCRQCPLVDRELYFGRDARLAVREKGATAQRAVSSGAGLTGNATARSFGAWKRSL
jgi:hypothetical protein